MKFSFLSSFLCILLLVSCSHRDPEVKEAKERVDINAKNKGEEVKPDEVTAEKIYNDAMDKLEAGRYEPAVQLFEQVEREFPYARWAVKAQLMAAYASYKDEEYDSALLALDRFIQLHPGNESVSYAYYLKALCYYDRIADVRRDQQVTEMAHQSLKEVIARFPNTEYAKDALLKLDLVLDHLAGKELEVGRHYQAKRDYIAAINRFKTVVDKYGTTSHVTEALHRLTETYLALGIQSEAQRYAAVLGYNFPDSKWYKYSFKLLVGEKIVKKKEKQSWLKATIDRFHIGD